VHDDERGALNRAIARLTEENARYRRKIEEAEVIIRRRSPNADGLTLKGAIKTILDDRDGYSDRIRTLRMEFKKALDLLKVDNFIEAKKLISLFLFSNPG
jgi:hypothetical protein